jgi:hypothetical protein
MATYQNKVPYYFEATNMKHLNAVNEFSLLTFIFKTILSDKQHY